MFLKSLDIFGFKSFADRTHIDFSDGITALLGPNGCGKSNVVDAIKWVLAENKAKNLRAEKKEDVIFNGTERRAPLNVAEVTLTMSNENGLLPLEESEIAIKRRLYRSGENEYFINNRPVGARDVVKLFMDTGVGKSAYSVMEQGKIDQILSSRPEDRRYLFEEAAGISRSKAECAIAERELEQTRQNMQQIEVAMAYIQRFENYYDVIVVDSTDPGGPGEPLFGEDFYRNMKKSLRDGGIIATQAESIYLLPEVVKHLMGVTRQCFKNYGYASILVPTYPTGTIGVCCGSDKYNVKYPVREIPPEMRDNLRYYTSAIHSASFVLPKFGEDLL